MCYCGDIANNGCGHIASSPPPGYCCCLASGILEASCGHHPSEEEASPAHLVPMHRAEISLCCCLGPAPGTPIHIALLRKCLQRGSFSEYLEGRM